MLELRGADINVHTSSRRLQGERQPANKPGPAEQQQGFQQTVRDDTTNAVKVSLQDCLACSGCVTTAETILLQHQSTDEMLQQLRTPGRTVVVTVSHQSRASLAAAYELSVSKVRHQYRAPHCTASVHVHQCCNSYCNASQCKSEDR